MNPKITDYQVLSHPTVEDLQKEVRARLKQGWQPLGGVAVVVTQEIGWGPDVTFYQAMAKYAATKEVKVER